jgi:hypothetical protein
MDILDAPEVQHESDISFFPTAIKWGLISAAFSIIYYLVAQLMGFAIPTTLTQIAIQFIIGIVITVLVAYFSIKGHKEEFLQTRLSGVFCCVDDFNFNFQYLHLYICEFY